MPGVPAGSDASPHMSLAECSDLQKGAGHTPFSGRDVEASLGKNLATGKSGRFLGRWSGEPVAIALANTWSCVAVLLGAIRSGLEVVSIPTPPRGVDVALVPHS